MNNQIFPVRKLGDYAANLLLPDSKGDILAPFSKVIYLRHTVDEVIWIVTEEIPLHRRAIQISQPLPEISVGTPYIVKNKVIILESGCLCDFHSAKKWEFPSLSPIGTLPLKKIKDRLDLFLNSLKDIPSTSGLGIFIPEIFNLTHDLTMVQKIDDRGLTALQKFARPIVQQLASACLTQDFDEILKYGRELIGLGEGLTPSGDDLMGGLLFCIKTLYDLFKPSYLLPDNKLVDFLENTKPRTNLISYTMLKDHAYGHASEKLQAFTHSLLTGKDPKSTLHQGSELVHIGHTTGWDMLTGVMIGVLFLYDSTIQNPIGM